MGIQPIQQSGVVAYFMTNSTVRKLYQRLQAVKEKQCLTDEEVRVMKIRFSSLDLFAGKTSEPNTLFFRPTPRKDYNVAGSGIEIDDFTRYPRSQLRFDALVRTYVQYARTLGRKVERPYEYLLYVPPFLLFDANS